MNSTTCVISFGLAVLIAMPVRLAGQSAPAGARYKCRDGSYSTAASAQDACARHGGVAQNLTPARAPVAPAAPVAAPVPEQRLVVRPYLSFGAMVTSPSASNLGYQCINCSPSAWDLTYKRANFGLGAQILFGTRPVGSGAWKLRLGVDAGWQTMFSEQGLLPGNPAGSYTTNDVSVGHLLALAELEPARGSVFLQGGAGLDFCWLKYRGYDAYVQDEWSNTSATAISLVAGAGMSLVSTPALTVPVMARLSFLARYGGTVSASVLAGVTLRTP